MTLAPRLLRAGEPEPVFVMNTHARGDILLVCEHAGRRLPEALGTLGLDDHDLQRHIAWDIGAQGLAQHLARHLDAMLIGQPYSRLVCDCNRRTDAPSLMPVVSEATRIPGNEAMDPAERRARIDEIHAPFHAKVAAEVEGHLKANGRLAFITLHSFTPVFLGVARAMHVGLLFDAYRGLADAVGRRLRAAGDIVVADNAPYTMCDGTDYTVPHHAARRGLPYLEIEVRNDLIAHEDGQRAWAVRLAPILRAAVAETLR